MSNDIDAFTKQLEKFTQLTEDAMTKTLRDVVVDIGSEVINLSPVLTGLFRGNWQMTVGQPASHSLVGTDASGAATLADLKSSVMALNPGEDAYIVNNLSYGFNVETEGWTKTPPYMPVRRTVSQYPARADAIIARNEVGR